MNLLSLFEKRVGDIFGASEAAIASPVSFKKLAKRASRKMKEETYVIDGVDTAPSLFTILVSTQDDSVMKPFYPQLSEETARFLEGQAQDKGLIFIGDPLVRFMVDPALRRGKFAIFAENIDRTTLEKLRAEEQIFLYGEQNNKVDGEVHDPRIKPIDPRMPSHEPLVPLIDQDMQPASFAQDPDEYGLDLMPDDLFEQDIPEEPVIDVPVTQRRNVPLVNMNTSIVGAGSAGGARPIQAGKAPIQCLFINRQTGNTFTAKAPRTLIGREKSAGNIVLNDPNISRRHAEVTFDGRSWHIHDLNSTNGTRVNDVDIDDYVLRDGDLVTLGLINLEFREA